MKNIVPISDFKERGLGKRKKREAPLDLVIIAVEMAMSYQCKRCVRRAECSKERTEEFCMDWEYLVSE